MPNCRKAVDLFGETLIAYGMRNYELAFALMRPFAENGNAEAQQYVAVMYMDGKGVRQDKDAARKWFAKASE